MDAADRGLPDPPRGRQAQVPRRDRARRRRLRQRRDAGAGGGRAAAASLVSAQPSFRALFGVDPRASGRAPGRVNLMGDHTDYNGGYVLPTVIPQQTTAEGAPIGGAGAHVIHSTTLERRLTAGAAPL